MPEDSPPPLPPAEEAPAADAEPAAAPEPERAEPSSAPITEPLFVCECAEWMREACDGLPIYRKHTDKKYCVLHYPGKEKAVEFESAFQEKLQARDFNFRGVW